MDMGVMLGVILAQSGSFFSSTPHDTYLKMMSALWGSFWATYVGASQDTLLSGGPRHGSPESVGSGQGAPITPPPPPQPICKPLFFHPRMGGSSYPHTLHTRP